LDYGAALSPPGSLWSTRWLDTSTSSGGQAGESGAHHGESSTEGSGQSLGKLWATLWQIPRLGSPDGLVVRVRADQRHELPQVVERLADQRLPEISKYDSSK